jgi:hypothetical protein
MVTTYVMNKLTFNMKLNPGKIKANLKERVFVLRRPCTASVSHGVESLVWEMPIHRVQANW